MKETNPKLDKIIRTTLDTFLNGYNHADNDNERSRSDDVARHFIDSLGLEDPQKYHDYYENGKEY